MHTTTRTPVFRSCVKIDQPHQQLLEEIAEYLELEEITLLSSSLSHHPRYCIHTRVDQVATIDCEGDSVPMSIVKTLTNHYTQIVIYQGGNIIDLPRDFPI